MRRLSQVLLALLAVTAVAAARPAADKTVGEKANGTTVHLKVGGKLTVKLAECDDCGYRWHTTKAPAAKVLKLTSSKAVSHVKPPAVGGTATRVNVYSARAEGTTTFTLRYRSPAGKDTSTFKLKVVVG